MIDLATFGRILNEYLMEQFEKDFREGNKDAKFRTDIFLKGLEWLEPRQQTTAQKPFETSEDKGLSSFEKLLKRALKDAAIKGIHTPLIAPEEDKSPKRRNKKR